MPVSERRSFRDPAGCLILEEDRALRLVNPEFAGDVLEFLKSPIARNWTVRGRLIASEVVDGGRSCSPLRLAHPRVWFPSYAWEWTPNQLGRAGQLTLDFCEDLIDAGWILKDATPSNVLFEGPEPVFVDVLSVQRHDPEDPIWLAYGQFVRTFLLPLTAFRTLRWPLATLLTRRDGYEPDDLYAALGPWQRMRAPWRSLVTLPALLGKRTSGAPGRSIRQSPAVARAILKRTLRSLRKKLQQLTSPPGRSTWSDYQESATHYQAADRTRKADFVQECLDLARPRHVLDIGGNTGFFSRIAASNGAHVVAWDTDVSATEHSWRAAQAEGLPVLPLVADFARPTPAAGWNNAETLSLLDRSRGRFEMVVMLAVLHHLLAHDQIPMGHVAETVRSLTSDWLLIEWVAPEDEKFRRLSNGRDALYQGLTEEAFLAAFGRYFSPVRRAALDNGRSLHLFRAK